MLQPILLTPDFQFVAGMRRVEAHKHLGGSAIVARLLDVEDEQIAGIEEDRARKPLSPSEKVALTELLRSKMTDEAFRRRSLGKKLGLAEQKGRVDDLLARHVGISRPTLLKFGKFLLQPKESPDRYGAIGEGLDKDGKVDRHYKRYQEESKKDHQGARFEWIVWSSEWQGIDAVHLCKAIDSMKFSDLAADECVLLIPSSIENLVRASSLVSRAKSRWAKTMEGTASECERLWLFGTFGKCLPEASAWKWLRKPARTVLMRSARLSKSLATANPSPSTPKGQAIIR